MSDRERFMGVDFGRLTGLSAPPEDLADVAVKLKDILRYQSANYPPEWFNNIWSTVYAHVGRAVEIVLTQQLPRAVDRSEVVRTLWIHDIPELIIGDEVAVGRVDHPDKQARERAAAEKLLRPQDRQRLELFNQAKTFLKTGEVANGPIDSNALFAGLDDFKEGNLYWYWVVTQKLRGKEVLGEYEQKMEPAFRYAFDQTALFKRNLAQITTNGVRVYAIDGLDQHIRAIKDMWKLVPPDKVPLIMKERLEF